MTWNHPALSQRALDEQDREIKELKTEIERLRRQRIEFDCRYTMGAVADISGNHCPIDHPCMRCQNERLRAALKEIATDDCPYPARLAEKTLNEQLKK